jgi:hypothetical protein
VFLKLQVQDPLSARFPTFPVVGSVGMFLKLPKAEDPLSKLVLTSNAVVWFR